MRARPTYSLMALEQPGLGIESAERVAPPLAYVHSSSPDSRPGATPAPAASDLQRPVAWSDGSVRSTRISTIGSAETGHAGAWAAPPRAGGTERNVGRVVHRVRDVPAQLVIPDALAPAREPSRMSRCAYRLGIADAREDDVADERARARPVECGHR